MSSRSVATFLSCALVLCACGGRKAAEEPVFRSFPSLQVPSLYSDPEDIMDYVLAHFWDPFLDTAAAFTTDSLCVLGVRRRDVDMQVMTYVSLLENSPLPLAQKSVSDLFDKLEKRHSIRNDGVFEAMTDAISSCLYEPNSPFRCEDIYLPFVTRLAASPYTPPERKTGLEHDARMCRLNCFGTPASDFRFKDNSGRERTLYSVKAEYTVLVFVNPGCHACGETLKAFSSAEMEEAHADGKVAVVDIYIDEDIEAWKKESDNLPLTWISGYDPVGIIRKDVLYNVRAIPSVYLLDAQKRVIMKDATEQKVMEYFRNEI